ncbi:MAG: hypothetical protein PHU25_04095 [Deltaproteobacteria bacterium]|nr:hypothetical protein [Deltaproteobacteria bacterium]
MKAGANASLDVQNLPAPLHVPAGKLRFAQHCILSVENFGNFSCPSADNPNVGSRIRLWQSDVVYSAVIRCVDRQFLLRPDHDPRHPLLTKGCPVSSLEFGNNLIPSPSIINIIGSAAARAKQLHPVRLHAVEANVNHSHVLISASRDNVDNLSDFFRTFNGAIASQLNRKHERDGHFWESRIRVTPCLDDRSAEQQLLYITTNPVKDGLVGTVAQSPLFTSYRALAHREPLCYWRIDWTRYLLAGGARKKSHAPKDYLEWLSLDLDPLPGQTDWPDHRRRAWFRRHVRDIETSAREKLRVEDRRVFGASALFALDPRDRPKNPKERGPQPLCHASDPQLHREFASEWREVMRAYRAASIDYRAGMHDREFPEGTFRPPLVKRCTALLL